MLYTRDAVAFDKGKDAEEDDRVELSSPRFGSHGSGPERLRHLPRRVHGFIPLLQRSNVCNVSLVSSLVLSSTQSQNLEVATCHWRFLNTCFIAINARPYL